VSTEAVVRTLVDELQKLLDPKNVVGEHIVVEDKILIPITKIGAGFGSGAGGGKGKGGERMGFEGEGSGTGAGAGAGVSPVALVAVFKGIPGPDGVKVIPLETPGPLSRAVGDTLPKLAEAVTKAVSRPAPETKERAK
jgi:uncharacterized spore protein YtfJ